MKKKEENNSNTESKFSEKDVFGRFTAKASDTEAAERHKL